MKLNCRNLYKFSQIKRLKRQVFSLKRALMVKQKCINYAIRKLDDYGIDYDYTFIHKDKKIVFNLFTGQKNIVKKYDKKLNDYEYEIFHGILLN